MKDGSRESAAGRWVSSFYGLSILGKMWPRRSSGPVTRGQGWGGGTAFFLVVAAICLACSRIDGETRGSGPGRTRLVLGRCAAAAVEEVVP